MGVCGCDCMKENVSVAALIDSVYVHVCVCVGGWVWVWCGHKDFYACVSCIHHEFAGILLRHFL